MKIISSQIYRNWERVEELIEYFAENNIGAICLPIIKTGCQDLDGEELYAMIDGHHRYEAAKELNIVTNFEIVEDIEDADYNKELTGEELLNELRFDSDWYYIDNGCPVW